MSFSLLSISVSFFLSSPPAVPASSKFTLGRVLCRQATFGLFCSLAPWAETHMHSCTHTCTHTRCNILLMNSYSQQQSVTFLRFANLHWFPAWFWASVPSSWMSLSLLRIQISPDIVCHVYSWTSLTFDNTLDISPWKFQIVFPFTENRHLYVTFVPVQ